MKKYVVLYIGYRECCHTVHNTLKEAQTALIDDFRDVLLDNDEELPENLYDCSGENFASYGEGINLEAYYTGKSCQYNIDWKIIEV